jgi:enoyl-CoA hydratase/carnithine racemase
MTTKDDHVLARRHDGVGHITLNRPGEINALTHEMVTTMRLSLRRWQQDATIRTVVIDGLGNADCARVRTSASRSTTPASRASGRSTTGRISIG